jgi:hypothetical protein
LIAEIIKAVKGCLSKQSGKRSLPKQSGIGVGQSSFAEGIHDSSSVKGVCHNSSPQESVIGVHHRSSLHQFKTNEEPEEVTGLCDVIGNVVIVNTA